MDDKFYILQNVEALAHLLWIVPLLAGVAIYAAARRKACLARFLQQGDPALSDRLRREGRRGWKAFFVVLAAALVIVALARPAWNPKPETRQQKGREVVFLLDVSRSMLAQDLRPSRLERAKLAILDCLNKIHGDRAGLIVFAGTAHILCPPTLDYGFLRQALEEAGPESVERGGTEVADAIRKATSSLENSGGGNQDIILITDGGDDDTDKTQEKFALEAARQAGSKGIRIIALGIGDEKNGSRIALSNEQGQPYFLQHNGKDVVTRLNAPLLRALKDATPDGKYVPVGTGDFDLGTIYTALVDNAQKKELQEKELLRYHEKFQLFLAAALALLIVEMLLRERYRTPRDLPAPQTEETK